MDGESVLIIDTTKLNNINLDFKSGFVSCECGRPIQSLSKKVGEFGFSNLEFAIQIPGSFGGGVKTAAFFPIENIDDCEDGLNGRISDILKQVKVIKNDGNTQIVNKDMISYSEKCINLPFTNSLIYEAVIKLKKWNIEKIKKNEAKIIEVRTKQRSGHEEKSSFSLGYTFTRNCKDYLYDGKIMNVDEILRESGVLNYEFGDMAQNPKIPGAIYNKNPGFASGEDYLYLANYIYKEVLKKTGVKLKFEVDVVNGPNSKIEKRYEVLKSVSH